MKGEHFWKPGEARPRKAEMRGTDTKNSSSKKRRRKKNEDTDNTGDNFGNEEGRSGGSGATSGDEEGSNRAKGDKERKKKKKKSIEVAGPPLASRVISGPSQGLLAMKFMQRKAKVNANQKQQNEKRKKLQDEFITSFTKRLESSGGEKDRLICRPDELDPALVFLGRRSFGGFNAVHETAYAACARAIASGLTNLEEAGDDEHGISDMEMASR